jgi:restriction endonuclease S subunit
VNNVKKLQIPALPLDRQKRIANLYKDKLDKIRFEKVRLAKLENEIDSLFEFVINGDLDA